MSNRQKVSGFLYDEANADAIRFRLELALAHHAGTVEHLIEELQAERAELEDARPAPQLPPAGGI